MVKWKICCNFAEWNKISIIINTMSKQICNDNCTYYQKENVLAKRFLWIILGATFFVVGLFVCVERSYKKSLDKIVHYHSLYTEKTLAELPEVNLSKDSCYYLDERLMLDVDNHMNEVQSMLEIQCHKIQSDFTILSLWAGILMIVFLIFSIYSVFKTDEMVKQGKVTLKVLEEAEKTANDKISKIEDVVQDEINKVKTTASEEVAKLSSNAENIFSEINTYKEATKKELKTGLDSQIDLFKKEIQVFLEQTKKVDDDKKEFIDKLFDIFMSHMNDETKEQQSEQNK